MQPCTDTDLKTSLILSQEYELQNLSFQIGDQIAHLKKLSEKVIRYLYFSYKISDLLFYLLF